MRYIELSQIKVAEPLVNFINDRVLPGLDIDADNYWQQFDGILARHLLDEERDKARIELRAREAAQLGDGSGGEDRECGFRGKAPVHGAVVHDPHVSEWLAVGIGTCLKR